MSADFDREIMRSASESASFDSNKMAQLWSTLGQLSASDFRRPVFEAHILLLLGRSKEAGDKCRSFAEDVLTRLAESTDLLNKFVEAAFRSRAFDALTKLIKVKYATVSHVVFSSQENDLGGPGVARWILEKDRESTFVFSEGLLKHPYADVILKHWVQALPVLTYFQQISDDTLGEVFLNLEDMGTLPGLAFCDHRPDFFLIPDPIFLGSNAYAEVKTTYAEHSLAWENRLSIGFWRGQTTGWLNCEGKKIGSWRELPRVRLCELASGLANGLVDAGLTGLAQITQFKDIEDIKAKNITKPYVHWSEFQKYKYLIDIDGNTSSWPGLFTKLCTGSVVLKVASSGGFKQWYYNRLIPWHNYVAIAVDMSDLKEKIEWLSRHDEVARQIGQNSLQLALSMTMDREVIGAEPALRAAFKQRNIAAATRAGATAVP